MLGGYTGTGFVVRIVLSGLENSFQCTPGNVGRFVGACQVVCAWGL